MDGRAQPKGRIRAFEPAVVEGLLARAAEERGRLEAALAVAGERISVARRRLDSAGQATVELAEMALEAERGHREADLRVAAVARQMLDAADAESASITAAARAEVARRALVTALRSIEALEPSADVDDCADLRGVDAAPVPQAG